MENIIQPNSTFDFSLLSLAQPTGTHNGSGTYFTRLLFKGKPLYIQTPKGCTKQGFIRKDKKIVTELMFDNNDDSFILWLENLELRCQSLIYEKNEEWFQDPLDKQDIETAFVSPIRMYKSGKFYLVRSHVKINLTNNIPAIKLFDESRNVLTMDDITNETNVISIIEIQGIKFTSRSFQIEIELKQMMTINSDTLFEDCVIQHQLLPKKENEKKVESKFVVSEFKGNEKKVESKFVVSEFKGNENKHEQEQKQEHEQEQEEEQEQDEREQEQDEREQEKEQRDNIQVHIEEKEKEKENESIQSKLEKLSDLLVNEVTFPEEKEKEKEQQVSSISIVKSSSSSSSKPILQFGEEVCVTKTKEKVKQDGNELEEIDFEIQSSSLPLPLPLQLPSINDENELQEWDIPTSLLASTTTESIHLKKPNQVYYEIYRQARNKAKQAKKQAILAFLEAKNIKKVYMLDDLDDESDEDDEDDYEEEEENNEDEEEEEEEE